jgi:hypothetical protein
MGRFFYVVNLCFVEMQYFTFPAVQRKIAC